jgi:hypothetical protein
MRRSALVVILAGIVVASGCASSKKTAVAKAPPGDPIDANACEHICAASAACGDAPSTCEPKCRDWLVTRSRPGIATATAKCAVPRIDGVCAKHEYARAAASALVACIDEAGRAALKVDNSALLVAARAICDRGARCNDASEEDADRCVEKITYGNKVPKGLGIFGAIKPDLVERFASCMAESPCGSQTGASACFGEMLGEDDDESVDDGGDEAAPPPPKPTAEPPGTKI